MIRCLIVDDEPLALDILEDFINKTPSLQLIGKYENPIEAIQFLQTNDIDLLFLDIKMPDISGIQLLKSLNKKPVVILTTAFKEYAIDGYELDVLDYLLKPIEFERFLRAVNKASEYFNSLENRNSKDRDFLFVKADYKLVKIKFNDILFIEAVKDYVKIKTEKSYVLTLMSMAGIEEKLPPDNFIRVHRSYIVSLNNVNTISRHRIIIGDKYIPISTPYRDKFYDLIKGFS